MKTARVIEFKMAKPAPGTEPRENLELKEFGALELKDEAKGDVEAIVATLGVVDRDGDVIREGAIKSGAKVQMSDYAHNLMWGGKPVGKGTLVVEGNKAVFKGRLFLKTADGRNTFETLKEMGGDQEWSFGFRVTGWEAPDEDEKKQGAFRILTKLEAFEVSPVLRGAGIGTRTVAVKSETPATPPADPIPAATPEAPEAPEPPPTPTPEEAAAAKAAADRADLELKQASAAEFERFQRTQRRLGVA